MVSKRATATSGPSEGELSGDAKTSELWVTGPQCGFGVYTNVDNFDQNAWNRWPGFAHTGARPTACPENSLVTRPLRLGVLTPSSNTALEPLTSALAAALPGASAHFSRFKVTEIALDAAALGQFDDSKILAAAELLADAKVDVIGWSGTSSGWLGFDRDRARDRDRVRDRLHVLTEELEQARVALNGLAGL